jgi:hypothetical protein
MYRTDLEMNIDAYQSFFCRVGLERVAANYTVKIFIALRYRYVKKYIYLVKVLVL